MGDLETTEPTDDVPQDRLDYVKPKVEAMINLAETVAAVLNMLLSQAELNVDEVRKHAANLPE